MRIQFIIGIICLLGSCVNSQIPMPVLPAIPGIATPVRIERDSAIVSLADYFSQPERLKHFNVSSGMGARWLRSDSLLVLSVEDHSKVLGNLRFRYEKYDYDIPVFLPRSLLPGDSDLVIRAESFKKDTIYFKSSGRNVQWHGYLQNYKLNHKFLLAKDTILKLVIPEEAEELAQGVLRIWASEGGMVSNDISVPLRKRQVVTGVADLERIALKWPENKVPAKRNDRKVYDSAVATFTTENKSFKMLDRSLAESCAYYGVHGERSKKTDPMEFYISYSPVKRKSDDIGMSKLLCLSDYDRLLQLLAFNATVPAFGKNDSYLPDSIHIEADSCKPGLRDSLQQKREDIIKQSLVLNGLSNGHIALIYGDFLPLRVEDQVYAYLRSYFDREVIVVFNKGSEPITLKLDLPRRERLRLFEALWQGRFSYDNSRIIMDLPAHGVEVIYN